MIATITYWIRIHCKWSKVTTSITEWAKLPHVVGSFACKAVPLVLIGLLPPTSFVPNKPELPPAPIESAPPLDQCCYMPTGTYVPNHQQAYVRGMGNALIQIDENTKPVFNGGGPVLDMPTDIPIKDVPEPSSLAIMAVGLIGLFFRNKSS